jgi:two-component system response regulator FlrC
MRLLIVGTLNGQLTTATKIAMDKGATVTHAADNAQAVAVLRSGRGADLLMIDVAGDIRDLVRRLEAEHIHAPIVACGIATDAPRSQRSMPAPRNTSRCRPTPI